jgi:hypothetical protein
MTTKDDADDKFKKVSDRIDQSQKTTKLLVQLSFFLIAISTITVIISGIFQE